MAQEGFRRPGQVSLPERKRGSGARLRTKRGPCSEASKADGRSKAVHRFPGHCCQPRRPSILQPTRFKGVFSAGQGCLGQLAFRGPYSNMKAWDLPGRTKVCVGPVCTADNLPNAYCNYQQEPRMVLAASPLPWVSSVGLPGMAADCRSLARPGLGLELEAVARCAGA